MIAQFNTACPASRVERGLAMKNMNETTHEIIREVARTDHGIILDLRHEIRTGNIFAVLRVSVAPMAFGGYEITVFNFIMNTVCGAPRHDYGRRVNLSRSVYVSAATLQEAIHIAYSRFYKHVEISDRRDFSNLDVTAIKY